MTIKLYANTTLIGTIIFTNSVRFEVGDLVLKSGTTYTVDQIKYDLDTEGTVYLYCL